jgi:hypothetical protein
VLYPIFLFNKGEFWRMIDYQHQLKSEKGKKAR